MNALARCVYRVESLRSLLRAEETNAVRLVRQFGPPHDYPHAMLETVRKQLPMTRAVYRLDCLCRPPGGGIGNKRAVADFVLLRIPERIAAFVEMTRVRDERAPDESLIYFGVDDAVSASNRLSPNLHVPFEKIDIQVGDEWLPLRHSTLAAYYGQEIQRYRPVAA